MKKKKLILTFISLFFCAVLFCSLTSCNNDGESNFAFKTLNVNDKTVYGKVSSDTQYFSFVDEIDTGKKADFIVSYDIEGTQQVLSKTIELAPGDNTVYVIEMLNNEPKNTYAVTIRRKLNYMVTFNTNGGTPVNSLTVEEDTIISEPSTSRKGYIFDCWNYDFKNPITGNTNITAYWQGLTDIEYKVEYYLENVAKDGYELVETSSLKGTVGTLVTADQKFFEHFKLNTKISSTSGEVDGSETLVLKMYYTRNVYTVTSNTSAGNVTNAGNFIYQKDNVVTFSASVSSLGYDFQGWYCDNELISTESTITTTLECNIEARFVAKQEMANFNFTSTETTCSIIGIKDKTVTEITFPDYVTSISNGAFSGCPNIESLTIPNGVSSIGKEAFSQCERLASLTIPDSVTDIGEKAFYDCTSLKEIYFNAIAMNDLTSYNRAFYDAGKNGNGIKLVIGANVTKIPANLFGQYNYSSHSPKITSIEFEKNSVCESIGDYAFYYCKEFTSLTIPDSVTAIGEYAFSGCYIETATIPFIAYSHINKSTLKTLVITSGSNISVYYTLGDSDSLTSVTIGNGVTSIAEKAFYGCTSLTNLVIGNNVTSIGNFAFYNCTSLKEIYFNAIAMNDLISNKAFGDAGKNGDGIKVVIGANVTKIPANLFTGSDWPHCPPRIKSVEFEKGSVCKTIGKQAFYGCASLTSVTIPNSVTSIGEKAFYDCTSLTSVTIPDSVTSIGEKAFYDCTKLTIYCEATSKPSDWHFNWKNCPVVWGYIANKNN